ncbi:phosphate acyltransferase PlsX [Alkalihalobacillus trypoxylicola]|uniref:Phosphate acyltransferase n=1 Tax=Alkalihalobacillus trypoxylicola TaxID=519424 RepID=A0A162F9T7_9BACI|nr:phosphate acyltransferase PlsX [Alkalihalobacillus trypoxylicola]KYG35118.1 phosphate acyltransferase [Alkalihalobacillus trypoxylicola]
MKIALDVMGGDHAPQAQVEAAQQAIKTLKELEMTLIGDEEKIKKYITNMTGITILHTTEKIEDTDQPTTAVRRKKDSSMVLAVREVKEGRADACISSGNTGALMTAGLLHVGRIPGIERPALAPMLPTVDGKGFLLLDVGANMDAKPTHLKQYALMGEIYMSMVRKVSSPKIGLVNVGTEDGKGNELMKESFALMNNGTISFNGNVEARDLLHGVVDVAVCDGFSGNLVLKSIEGTASAMFSILKKEFTKSAKNKIGAAILKPSFKDIKQKLDYSEYGGAALFGLKAPVIKAHGSSDSHAVYHAIRQAYEMVQEQVVTIITNEVAKIKEEVE